MKTQTIGTTQDLLAAGYRKDGNNWEHAKGLLYRDERSGHWYFRPNAGGVPVLITRKALREGIQKAVEVVR